MPNLAINRPLITAAWIGGWSMVTLLTWGYDKWQAGRKGERVSEATLCALSAFGGWPGGLLGLLLFRHKSAKRTFIAKFLAAFGIWAMLLWLALTWETQR